MGEGEGKALGGELLDVRALDVIGLLKLDNTENLEGALLVILHLLGTLG